MEKKPDPWFVSYRSWQSSLPIRWQGWAFLLVFFVVALVISHALDGMTRAWCLAGAALIFFAIGWQRTRSITGTDQPKNPWYWFMGGRPRG